MLAALGLQMWECCCRLLTLCLPPCPAPPGLPAARAAKALAVAPRPVAGLLRPVVHGQVRLVLLLLCRISPACCEGWCPARIAAASRGERAMAVLLAGRALLLCQCNLRLSQLPTHLMRAASLLSLRAIHCSPYTPPAPFSPFVCRPSSTT